MKKVKALPLIRRYFPTPSPTARAYHPPPPFHALELVAEEMKPLKTA